jgi:uncharacterized protein
MRSLLAVFVMLGAATCERAPSEASAKPASASSAATAAASPQAGGTVPLAAAPPRAVSLAGRCILPTPSQPAAPVAAGPDPSCPPDPDGPTPGLEVTRVTFADVGGVVVDAQVVRTPRDNARGLMYVKHMEEERGMLFDLGEREDHKFWMHNTCIPLDMLFIDTDGLIVGIVENAPTLNEDSRGVGCPSRWVLEVNAGWARRHGVRAGGFARFAR